MLNGAYGRQHEQMLANQRLIPSVIILFYCSNVFRRGLGIWNYSFILLDSLVQLSIRFGHLTAETLTLFEFKLSNYQIAKRRIFFFFIIIDFRAKGILAWRIVLMCFFSSLFFALFI